MTAPDLLLTAMDSSDLERLTLKLQRTVDSLATCWTPAARAIRRSYEAQLERVSAELARRERRECC